MPSADPSERLTPRHWLLILVLAAVQFTHIVDFMIVMPLGPKLQKGLGIDLDQFGWVLSSYGLAACVSGLVLARLVDRFDRKTSLLLLFVGFTAGTFLCAFAPDYAWLLVGRVVAGGFGGVAGATVLAIIGDGFPLARRGTATGAVMSAFSLATIVGVPAGLVLAGSDAAGWRTPFVALGAFSVVVLVAAAFIMPPIRSHLLTEALRPSLLRVVAEPAYLRAYSLMFFLNFSGFLVFSFMTMFLVKTVGVDENREVWLIYFVGGLTTLVSMNVIGRLSDRFSRRVIFQCVAAAFTVPAILLTYLPHGTPLAVVLFLTTCLMVLGSGRGVPAMALVTGVARPSERGAFLSVNSSIQMMAITIAPLITAHLLSGGEGDAPLVGFPYAGWLSAAMGLTCVALVMLLRPADEEVPLPPEEAVAEATEEVVESMVGVSDARLTPTPPRG